MKPQFEQLWNGQVAQVVATLDQLDLQQPRWPDLVQEAPNYFRSNQERMRYDQFHAPKATRSAAAPSKAPLILSSIIVCAGLAAAEARACSGDVGWLERTPQWTL